MKLVCEKCTKKDVVIVVIYYITLSSVKLGTAVTSELKQVYV